MILFLIFWVSTTSANCCLSCQSASSTSCLVCNSGAYLFNSQTCLPVCPSSYTQSGSSCTQSSPLLLFDGQFYSYTNLNSRGIQSFSNPFNFRFSSKFGMTFRPTADRGFYSSQFASLIGTTNWVPAPQMTTQCWVLPQADGNILQVISLSSQILIGVKGNFSLFLTSLSQPGGLSSSSTYSSANIAYGSWHYVSIQHNQVTGALYSVKIIINGNELDFSMANQEISFSLGASWFIGSTGATTAFSGFLYQLRVDNQILPNTLQPFTPPTCSFSQFYSAGSCQTCSACLPNCVDFSCSFCVQCFYCAGFSLSDCSCGSSACCQTGCLSCESFYICKICDLDYVLVNGVCVASVPLIAVNFTGDFLGKYGGFVTGSDETLFYYKNAGELIDPMPVLYRGFYFTGGAYLVYDTVFELNQRFSIAMWVKYNTGGLLKKGTVLQFDNGVLSISLLSTSNNQPSIFSSSPVNLLYVWTHLAFNLNSESLSSFVSIYLDNTQVYSNTLPLFYFKDPAVDFLFVGIASSSFTGFIYSFKLWQAFVQDFGYEFLDEMCGKSLSSSCFSECPINSYTSTTCLPCTSSCVWGCVDSRTTCTVCSSYLCQYCDNFNTTICLQCIANASGQPCVCNDGYYDFNFICNPCYARCEKCSSSSVSCIFCASPYYFLGSLCLQSCPTSYTQSSNTCIKQSSTALSLDFRYSVELGSLSSSSIGSDSSNKYPSFDPNDPWPVHQRGYYFSSGSYILQQLVFSPYLGLSIWIKTTTAGKILTKTGTLSFISTSATSYSFTLTLTGAALSCTLTTSTGWVFLSFYLSFNGLNTGLNYLINNSPAGSATATSDFLSDVPGAYLWLGNTMGGFAGFIVTVHVYTDSTLLPSSYSLACVTCSCSYCLSSCTIAQDPNNNCAACPAPCTTGCSNAACNICADPLCSNCSDRQTSSCSECVSNSTGPPCVCFQHYFRYLQNCFICFDRCDSCLFDSFLCETCKAGFKKVNYFCVEACPTGYTENSGICSSGNLNLFDIDFSDLIILSYIQGFAIGKNSSNIYPNYDESDPWPSFKRGYYFNNNSVISNYSILAPNFTLTMWVLVKKDGEIIGKTSNTSAFLVSAVNSSLVFALSLQGQNISIDLPFNSSLWVLFSLSLFTNFNLTTVKIYFSGTLNSTNSLTSYYSDTNTSLLIPPSQSFNGFIWRLALTQSALSPIPAYSPTPTSVCPISTYPDSCTACPNCVYSCSNNSCNICPDKLCKFCISFTLPCAVCKNNSTLTGGFCVCDLGFYSKYERCNLCSPRCRGCSDRYMSSCTVCVNGLVLLSDGVCGVCGLGYKQTENFCKIEGKKIFEVSFNNTMKGSIPDTVNGFLVTSTPNSDFYPNYKPEDPFVAFLRGYYFTGSGSVMTVSDKRFILPHMFVIDFWMNQETGSGVLFEKGELGIYLNESFVKASINLTDSVLNFSSNQRVSNFSWTHVVVSFTFLLEETTVSFNSFSFSSPGFFIDSSVSATLGKGKNGFFQGFLYSFSIYSYSAPSRVLTACLDACSECLQSGYCIPNCPLYTYWIGPKFNDCSYCRIECRTGCRSYSSCSICADEKCALCESLEIGSACTTCTQNSILNRSCECSQNYTWNPYTLLCFTCKSDQFIYNYKCVDCPKTCLTCRDGLNCLTCVSESSLQGTMCYCNIGYHFLESCHRHVLNITLEIDSENQGLLIFNESLKHLISADDLNVTVPGTWTIERFSDKLYKIKVEYSESVKADQVMQVNLTGHSKLVSVTNATPTIFFFQGNLSQTPLTNIEILQQAKKLAQAVTTAVTSAVTASSMMNPNPACLWSFINTVQMVVFIVLANVYIPTKSRGLIIGLKNYNFFPNVFEYFMVDGKSYDIKNAYELGYVSDSVILNTGRAVTAFVAFMLLWVLLLLLNILVTKKCITKKFLVDNIKELLADYKYGFFIRYGITNYIEFQIAAFIGILNFKSVGWYSITNTVLSSVILIILLTTPLLCYIMVSKRRQKQGAEKEEFDTLYGTLFYEFNNDKGVMSSYFYVFFFLKRAAYGIILIFLRDYGLVQMTLILIICFAYLLYLINFKPFGERILNYSNISSELVTIVIFGLITFLVFDKSESTRQIFDSIIYYLVYVIMGIQMAASVGLICKTVKNKIAEKINMKAAVAPMSSYDPEAKQLNVFSFSGEVSRLDMIEARSKKTASGLSKYGKYFEDN